MNEKITEDEQSNLYKKIKNLEKIIEFFLDVMQDLSSKIDALQEENYKLKNGPSKK